MPERSADLLQRARGGSAEALNELYDRCAARLLGYIRLRLGRDLRARLESRDILQAAMLKSVEHLREFKGGGTRSFLAWLARIAEHEIRDCAALLARLFWRCRSSASTPRRICFIAVNTRPSPSRSTLARSCCCLCSS